MGGMFYSLQEVIERLQKSEEEIEEIVKNGRLREFRDGPNLLFKIDEVESLLSDTSIMAAREDEPEEKETEEEISLAPEPETDEPFIEDDEEAEEEEAEEEDEEADTVVAGEGVNILGETDSEYQLADDTLAETKAVSDEATLEEIEEDVNLDTFGSGSGLLDLSLQADDTSLGGILDEIYTADEGEAPSEATGEGSAEQVAAEAEEMLPEEEFLPPEPAQQTVAMVAGYIESEPDTASNTFGLMLFLPILITAYTIIVAIAGSRGFSPAILKITQGMIWYIMAGAVVIAGLTIASASMLGPGTTKKEKKPKVKKEKKKKEKKKKKKGKKGEQPAEEITEPIAEPVVEAESGFGAELQTDGQLEAESDLDIGGDFDAEDQLGSEADLEFKDEDDSTLNI